MVCSLFLNTAEPSDSGSPRSESCVVCHLRSFPTSGSSLSPTCWWPSCCLFTDGSQEFNSLPHPLLCCTFSNSRPLHCALVFSSFVYSVFFFFVLFLQEGTSLFMRVVLVYPRGGWGIPHETWLSPVWSAEGPPSILELAASGGSMGVVARLFSQCIMVRRSLPLPRVSGCLSFISPWCLTSAKHGSSVSARSLIHGAHTVWACVPVAILDPIQSTFL
jgi:hypothetical protein